MVAVFVFIPEGTVGSMARHESFKVRTPSRSEESIQAFTLISCQRSPEMIFQRGSPIPDTSLVLGVRNRPEMCRA